MALTINTNLFSIDTQKNLSNAQSPLATAMQRLSSGLKINNASDDAAGLAIATRMQRQIDGLAQNLNNANNGISFAQTAEGATTEMTNDLQRIYTLSNQSASYNTSSDRSSMNQEVTQLVAELNRVTAQTRFNGQQFLNQAFSANFQVGTEVNETINITTKNVSPNAFGVQSTINDFTNSTTNLGAIASSLGTMTLQSTGLLATATLGGVSIATGASIAPSVLANNSNTVISRVNQYTAQTNVTAFSFGNAFIATHVALENTASIAEAVSANYLTINGIAIGSTTATVSSVAGGLASKMVTAINAKTSSTGVTAIVLGTANSGAASTYSIALVNTSGGAITVAVATANANTAGADAGYFATGGSIAAGQNGQVVFSTPLGDTSKAVDSANTETTLGFGTSAAAIGIGKNQSINNIDITTVGGANLAILAVEQGIETMNTQQSYLGAVVNRFSSTVRSIQNISENTSAAKSRIMDADYAVETSNLTKAMITQQAGISVLAQANNITQQVLSLLPK